MGPGRNKLQQITSSNNFKGRGRTGVVTVRDPQEDRSPTRKEQRNGTGIRVETGK